jgi:hypothetical protein
MAITARGRYIEMEMREIVRTSLGILLEFKEQASEIAGSGDFLDGYVESLEWGLSRLNDLDTAEKWALLEDVGEVLDIIAAENERATFLPGSALKGAIIQGLRNEIGAAIEGLDDTRLAGDGVGTQLTGFSILPCSRPANSRRC